MLCAGSLLVLGACQPAWHRIPPPPATAPLRPAGHAPEIEKDPDSGVVLARSVLLHDGEGGSVRDGLEETFWGDGTPRSSRRFEIGVPAGTWLSWWPSGVLRSEQLHPADGSPGRLRFFHPSGELRAEGLAGGGGSRVGTWRFWRPDGSLEKTGAYRRGQEDGPWEFFDPAGGTVAKGSYEAGARVGVWTLDSEGEQ